jgi:hypothetical protein
MFTIKVERADVVADVVTGMINQIDRFPVPMTEEFVEWQRQDMRRRYPKIDVLDPVTVATSIFPRSRRSKPYKPVTSRLRPRRKLVIRSAGRQKANSTRPILRPQLFDSLRLRMAKLMEDTLQWP